MMDAFELPTTLVQALRRRAVQEPERLALRFLAEDDGEGVVLSYRDLDLRARSIAAALQAHAQLGDRAVLLFQRPRLRRGVLRLPVCRGHRGAGLSAGVGAPPSPGTPVVDHRRRRAAPGPDHR